MNSVAPDSVTDCMGRLDGAFFAKQRLGLTPDPQQAALLSGNWHRVLLNCSRQWGKSTVTAAKAIHHAFYHPESLTVVVSPASRQSSEFLKKAETFVRRLGLPIKRDAPHEVSLRLPNGSRIIGLPSNEDTVRGFSSVSLMLVDEAARVPNDIYSAVRPMLAVADGDLWLMSTPKGQQGFFFDAWTFGGPGWHRVTAKASDNPRVKPRFLAEQRATMSEREFRQEYECEFLEADDAIVQRAVLERTLNPDVKPLRGYPWGGTRPWLTTEPFRNSRFFIGVDLGQKVDYTAIAVLERYWEITGERNPYDLAIPKAQRFDIRHLERVPRGTEYGDVVKRIGRLARCGDVRGNVTLIVDATGVGAPVVELLRHEPLDCQVVPVIITGADKVTLDRSTYRVPRQDLLDGLVIGMEQGWLRVAYDLSEAGTLVREMANLRSETGSRGERWTAQSQKEHDDLVFATALATWWARR